ncbi:alpha-2B adrenergic receptor-like [Paramacrobiotus metropolitanus]|uniref:alpha-2B adrenergic receptor-like n=1 Tax=Paramacrobiotus metropolitanus TaxID=2943436 RepID=UPI0024459389|nr:alpha-2B adrenergic receptor-like [Paramacrobiotus metropolitanus]
MLISDNHSQMTPNATTPTDYTSALLNVSIFSTVSPPAAQWTAVPIFTLIIFLLVLLVNATVLYVFYANPHLRTPFTIYLINLFSANIIIALLQNPLDVLFELYGRWTFGHVACSLYLYGSYAVSGGTMVCHVVISANRIWAIVFPLHYRLHHSKRVAVWICVGIWGYVHVLIVPGLVMDGLWYRQPLEKLGCQVNMETQTAWSGAVHWLIYNIAEIFVVGAYPFIWYFRKKSRKVTNLSDSKPSSKPSDEANTTLPRVDTIISLETMAPPAPPKPRSDRARAYSMTITIIKQKENTHAFTMLTFLTCSVALCWTPIMVFYGLAPYMGFPPVFYPLARGIYALQAVADPIVFTLALREVWNAFVEMGRSMVRSKRRPSTVPTVTT